MLFLRMYGYILILFSLACLYTLFVSPPEGGPFWSNYFVIIVSAWYLITGMSILTRQAWGYYLFIFFLYVLFLAFPIGTIISYKSLKYIKKNDIKGLFNKGI